jgi:hypothetical protein
MSIICYMSVICLVQSPPQEAVVVFGYIEGPFLVSRTGCARHEHKYMGHETANWGGRGLGYMLFNAHLCNQPCLYKVVVGPGAQICTL